MIPLTDRQRQMLDLVVATVCRTGRPPTIRELMAESGVASPNGVSCHLKALERKGHLARHAAKDRGFTVLRLVDGRRVVGWAPVTAAEPTTHSTPREDC
jgi:repressor LexA